MKLEKLKPFRKGLTKKDRFVIKGSQAVNQASPTYQRTYYKFMGDGNFD